MKSQIRSLFSAFIAPNLLTITFFGFTQNTYFAENLKNQNNEESFDINKDSNYAPNKYILGPGDQVFIGLMGLPELSGSFFIGPDGYVYLPELMDVYMEGLTLEELREDLTKRYKKFVKHPQISLKIASYRPVRVYVAGEVKRPGLYTFAGSGDLNSSVSSSSEFLALEKQNTSTAVPIKPIISSTGYSKLLFPTLFDVIKASQGITTYSKLSSVEVVRHTSRSKGGGKIKSSLDFLSVFTDGDLSQNIRIFDGDTVIVPKSSKIVPEQIFTARESNLSPDYINVYVSGNVLSPGSVVIPQGSGLTHAIAMAGGKKILSGRIEFLRFNKKGDVERRNFSYDPSSRINTLSNPILMSGDIINVRMSLLGNTTEVLRKVSSPIFTGYALYNLFD